VDFAANMLAAARAGGVPLVRADGSMLPIATAAVDGLVCGFALRNFADLAAVLGESGRVVRPGGRISLLEVDEPRSRVLRVGHRVWFRGVVPRLGALFSDADAYRYLPRSVAHLPPPAEMATLLAGAGFVALQRIPLHGGIAQIITATRDGSRQPTSPPRSAPSDGGRA
jgi:demethylmenaquinone methyltransferase/2-methoxy-6-polyprenyl-1,4-benzoquinol methylase